MKYQEYLHFVKSDLYRYTKELTSHTFIKCFFLSPGFRYTFLMRTARYLACWQNPLRLLYVLSRWVLHHYKVKYGIDIPYNTDVGPGFYIGHFGGIFVNHEAKIGKNCNINHDVTIGATFGGKHPGVPAIGDNVYFGPGSKVIGGIKVGNHVAIGANSVVNMDVPDKAVVIGNPGRIVSDKGSASYIVNTDWERFGGIRSQP
jgi:serine O-acetyltransferase